MKNTQKGSIVPLLIGIIVILVIAIGVYSYIQNRQTAAPAPVSTTDTDNTGTNTEPVSISPTPVLLAGWKTYTNTTYNFAFDYPSSMRLSESGSGTAKVVSLTSQPTGIPVLALSINTPNKFRIDSPYGVTTYDPVKKEWNINTGDSRTLSASDLKKDCLYLNAAFIRADVYATPHSSMGETMGNTLVTDKGLLFDISTFSDSGKYDATTTTIYNSFRLVNGTKDIQPTCVQIQ